MNKNTIIKQITITKQDIVCLFSDELFNSGALKEFENEEIEKIHKFITYELIQTYCKNDIELVLKSFKTSIDDMEIDELEFWFGFNCKGFIDELKKYKYFAIN